MNLPLALFTDWLQTLSNASLNLDERAKEQLQTLDGQRIAIRVTQPLADFSLILDSGEIRLTPTECIDPHVQVSGDIPGLMSALITGGRYGDINIAGDELLLQKLKDIFTGYQPDLPPGLSKLVSSPTGEQILGSAELGLSTLATFAKNLATGLKDSAVANYVDEQGMDGFLDRLDDLRLRVDRLGSKIRKKGKPPS